MQRRRRLGYIPTLDGWRAVSILAVIAYHMPPIPVGHFSLRPVQNQGWIGVVVFFVISGLLICSRLLDEEELNGRISLRSFYIRRVWRIQPAALVFLATIAVLGWVNAIPFSAGSWWTAILAVRNYYPHAIWDLHGASYTSHFWSLSVEEHFYLLLPSCLIFLQRKRRKLIMGVIACLSLVFAQVASHFWPANGAHTEIAIVSLLLPAWVAIMLREDSLRAKLSGTPLLGFFCLGLLIAAMISHFLLHDLLIRSSRLLVIISLVCFTTLNPQSILGRILETKPLAFIGRISYSLYLWQQLFCVVPWLSHAGPAMRALQQTPWNLILTFAVALFSYYCIERPLIRVGHRIAETPRTARTWSIAKN